MKRTPEQSVADGTRELVKERQKRFLLGWGAALAATSLIHLGIHFTIEKSEPESCMLPPASVEIKNEPQSIATQMVTNSYARYDEIKSKLYKDALSSIETCLALRAAECDIYISSLYDDGMSELRIELVKKLEADGFIARRSLSSDRSILVNLEPLYSK